MKKVILCLACFLACSNCLFSQVAAEESEGTTEPALQETTDVFSDTDNEADFISQADSAPADDSPEIETAEEPEPPAKLSDEELKKKEEEKAKRDAIIDKIIEKIYNAKYSVETKNGIPVKTTETLYLANELSQYEPFKTFRSGRWESYYVLNKASIKYGLAPVYSVDGEYDPEKWPVEKKSNKMLPDINEENDGFRRNEYQYDWHFSVSHFLTEEEKKVEEERLELTQKAASGNEYLSLLGFSFKEVDKRGIVLFVKKSADNKDGAVEVSEDFKIFEITVEKKSLAGAFGLKTGDLLIVDNSGKGLSSKIIIDSKVFDLSTFGKTTSAAEICGIFEKAKTAKKIAIQIRRQKKNGYEQKEIIIRN